MAKRQGIKYEHAPPVVTKVRNNTSLLNTSLFKLREQFIIEPRSLLTQSQEVQNLTEINGHLFATYNRQW